MKLIPGAYYTVKSGRFEGITGIALQPNEVSGAVHELYSPDLPKDGVVSFLNSGSLRVATAEEELEYRRRRD